MCVTLSVALAFCAARSAAAARHNSWRGLTCRLKYLTVLRGRRRSPQVLFAPQVKGYFILFFLVFVMSPADEYIQL